MQVIHKQAFDVSDIHGVVSFETPLGAEVLKVASQHEKLAFWYIFDTSVEQKEVKQFLVAGTGLGIRESNQRHDRYFDSVMFSNGSRVLHVFEILDVPF